MVIGIQYGGNGVVTLTHTSQEDQNSEEIKGSLEAKFKGFPFVSSSGGGSGNVSNSLHINDNELGIKVEADVAVKQDDDITSVEGAKTFMKHLGSRLSEYNDGKGIQISYELIPIKTVTDFFGLAMARNIIYKTLQGNVLATITRRLAEIEDVKEELNERIFELECSKKYFTRSEIDAWGEEELNFNNKIATVRTEMSAILEMFQDDLPEANNRLQNENDKIAGRLTKNFLIN